MNTNALSLDALRLAAESGCDPRTCMKVLREGPHVVRTRAVRLAIERAAVVLTIKLPSQKRSA